MADFVVKVLAYLAAVAALLSGAFLNRRREFRQRRNRTYGYVGLPATGDPLHDRIELFCGKRRD